MALNAHQKSIPLRRSFDVNGVSPTIKIIAVDLKKQTKPPCLFGYRTLLSVNSLLYLGDMAFPTGCGITMTLIYWWIFLIDVLCDFISQVIHGL